MTSAALLICHMFLQISFQHIEFAETGLPPFGELAPSLSTLEIRECTNFDPLLIPENSFKGLESSLKNLTIDSCNLKVSHP